MIKRSSSYLALPVQGAALLAGKDSEEAKAVADQFIDLGTLFQLQDDILDLYGDKGRDHVGSDLYEGKVSALVVAHLLVHPDERKWLLDLLEKDRNETSDSEVKRAIEKFRNDGALDVVISFINQIIDQLNRSMPLRDEPGLHLVAETDDATRVRVAFRVFKRFCVGVDCTFHCPDPRTIVMTIVDGEGVGSVVETHATPIVPGYTAVIEAIFANSERIGFRVVRRPRPLIRPVVEYTARRLWVEDSAYAERKYALRQKGQTPIIEDGDWYTTRVPRDRITDTGRLKVLSRGPKTGLQASRPNVASGDWPP